MKILKNKKIMCGIVFAVMLLFLQMQFRHVMVYFDDYGYYSLSYGMPEAAGGHEFTFGELFSYLKAHYSRVNGRLPGYILWLSLYIIGGLPLVQISAAFIVTIILFVIWKYINNSEYPVITSIIVCTFYGLIAQSFHKQGTYWFAAFFQYIAPVALIVSFVMFYFKTRDEEFKFKNFFILFVLAFFSAYSQEQLSVAVTFMMCLLFFYELINKNFKSTNLIYIFTAFSGFALLMMSTSSLNRASGAYTLIETIIYSTYKTIRTFYAADSRVFIILLYIAVLIFSLKMFRNDHILFKLFDLCGIALATATIAIYAFTPLLEAFAKGTMYRYYVLITLGVPCIALIVIQIMRYYWQQKQFSRFILFMTAVGSVGCLCVVPEVPPRLFIPSWMLLFPLLADGIFVVADQIKNKKISKGFVIATCLIIAALSAINTSEIYSGYAQNAAAYEFNDAQLSSAAELEGDGEQLDKVFLKIMPDYDCAAALIYDDEVTYMTRWMKYYYGFENMPALYFSENGEETEDLEAYSELSNQVFINDQID